MISVAQEGIIGSVRPFANSIGIVDEEVILRYEAVEKRAAKLNQPEPEVPDPNFFVQGVSGQGTGGITQGGPPLTSLGPLGDVAPPGRTVQGFDQAKF